MTGAKAIFVTFLLSSFFALAGLLARLGYQLGGEPPPEDPILFKAWKRRQMWTMVAEFSTLPAFGAAWTAASMHWQLSIPFIVGGSMLSGALGFGFILDALQRLLTRKLGNV